MVIEATNQGHDRSAKIIFYWEDSREVNHTF
jgi:hypothetical protein